MVLAATDRFRLAVRELTWSTDSAGYRSRGAGAGQDAGRNGQGRVRMARTCICRWAQGRRSGKEGLLGIRSDGKRSTTRLLDAEFPKFRQLLPDRTHGGRDASVSRNSPRRSSGWRWWPTAAHRFGWNSPTMRLRLSAGADDVGRAEEDLPVAFSGDPLTIAFNPTYLTDGLGSLHSERVTFGFTTPSRPAVLRPAR